MLAGIRMCLRFINAGYARYGKMARTSNKITKYSIIKKAFQLESLFLWIKPCINRKHRKMTVNILFFSIFAVMNIFRLISNRLQRVEI